MNKFIGIDLHSNNSVIVVTDEEDRVVFQKRLPNSLEEIRLALCGLCWFVSCFPERQQTGALFDSSVGFAQIFYLALKDRFRILCSTAALPRGRAKFRCCPLGRRRTKLNVA